MDTSASPATSRDGKPKRRRGKSNAATAAPDAPGQPPVGNDRRRELRERPVRGSVIIDDVSYEIFDWSSSGVCVRGYDGDAEDGHRTRSRVHIVLPDMVFDFGCDLVLVRLDRASKQLAGVFTALSREVRVAVAAHFETLEARADESLKAELTRR